MESQESENNGQSSPMASVVKFIPSDVPTRRKPTQKNTGNVSWDTHHHTIIQIQPDCEVGALHKKNFHLAFHAFFMGQNQIGGTPTEIIWVPNFWQAKNSVQLTTRKYPTAMMAPGVVWDVSLNLSRSQIPNGGTEDCLVSKIIWSLQGLLIIGPTVLHLK